MTKVLLHKATCEILEGVRVSFFDKCQEEIVAGSHVVQLQAIEHDGWLLWHPRTGPFSYFMNREFVEKDFIELGDLDD